MTVTFVLGYRKESPRIDVATEPYPNRWTHHVMVGCVEEIDEELMNWIQEAAEFSAERDNDMDNEKVFAMSFSKVYLMLIAKAERKGRFRC